MSASASSIFILSLSATSTVHCLSHSSSLNIILLGPGIEKKSGRCEGSKIYRSIRYVRLRVRYDVINFEGNFKSNQSKLPSIALHCTTHHYTTLFYTTPHYTTLHYTTQYCTALHFTTLYYTVLHYTTPHTLHNITRLYSTLLYTTLLCTTLHYTTLHYAAIYYTIL